MAMTEDQIYQRANTVAKNWGKELFKQIEEDNRLHYTDAKTGTRELTPEGKQSMESARTRREGVFASVVDLLHKDPSYAYLDGEDIVNQALGVENKTTEEYMRSRAEKKRKQNFAPFVQFNEEGKQPWYDMPYDKIRSEALKIGYNLEKSEDKDAFWKLLRYYSQGADNAKMVNDESHSLWGETKATLFPSAHDEAVKQSLTGNYDSNKMALAGGLDGARIGSIVGGPVADATRMGAVAVAKHTIPKAMKFIPKGTSALPQEIYDISVPLFTEAGAQGTEALAGVGDETFDTAPIIFAGMGTAGLGAKGAVKGVVGKAGKTGKKVAEGISATEGYTAKELERQNLKELVKKGEEIINAPQPTLQEMFANNGSNPHLILQEGFGKDIRNAEKQKAVDAYNLFHNTETVDNLFDNPTLMDSWWKDVTPEPMVTWWDGTQSPLSVARKKTEQAQDMAPALKADMVVTKDKPFRVGQVVGHAIQDVGGRGEAIIKAGSGEEPTDLSNLEQQNWFKNLSKKQQKIIKRNIANSEEKDEEEDDGLFTDKNP